MTDKPKDQKRTYFPCQKVVEMFPTWKVCGRPTKGTRCDLHPVKKLWPVEVA